MQRWPRKIGALVAAALVAGTGLMPVDGATGASERTPAWYVKCRSPRIGRPVHLLIVTGGHLFEPLEFFQTFEQMKGIRFQHVMMGDGKPISVPEGGLGQYDVVLFYDFEQGEITPEWRALLDRGKGFVFIHHSLGSFPRSQDYRTILGGAGNFEIPPSGTPKATYKENVVQRITPVDPASAITCGMKPFDLLDEYYDGLEFQSDVHVILTSDKPKEGEIVGWTYEFDNKRVVALQPGHGNLWLPSDHGPSSYQSPEFKQIIQRAIFWAAGGL